LQLELPSQEKPTVKEVRKIPEAARTIARHPETGNHTLARRIWRSYVPQQNVARGRTSRSTTGRLLYNPRGGTERSRGTA
jgi:hypothetical protein